MTSILTQAQLLENGTSRAPSGDGAMKLPRRSSRRRRPRRNSMDGRSNANLSPSQQGNQMNMNNNSVITPSMPNQQASTSLNQNSPNVGGQQKRKRRHRRGGTGQAKRRKQQNEMMTATEREQRDRDAAQRAEMKRALRFRAGQPMAPYNTGQFLMEDRLSRDQQGGEGSSSIGGDDDDTLPGGVHRRRTISDARLSTDGNSDDNNNTSGDSLEREFEENFEQSRVDWIESLPHNELIRSYLDLETSRDKLRDEVARLRDSVGKLTRERDTLLTLVSNSVSPTSAHVNETVLGSKEA